MLSLSYQILIFPCHIFYQPPSFINRDSPTKAMNAKGFLILIHAPHARSDHCFGPIVMETGISIHAPHARSDMTSSTKRASWLFQSTLLMRGATNDCTTWDTALLFQSTLLMRGATIEPFDVRLSSLFQSTLLMRGATSLQGRRQRR